MHQQQTAFENIMEKEKLLITSNFSLSHNVFYSIKIIASQFAHIFDVLSNPFPNDKF